MKTQQSLRWLAAGALCSTAVLFAGCSTTPLDDKPAPVTERTSPPPASTAPSASTDTRTVARVDTTPKAIDPLTDPNSPLAKRSIFFEFDRFEVRRDFLPVVEAHGQLLSKEKARRIVIEGNADERGSREYNLALGQKRADAVKSRLVLLGVADAQIETVSFGEERPRATGRDEEAFAQNRRADIVYK